MLLGHCMHADPVVQHPGGSASMQTLWCSIFAHFDDDVLPVQDQPGSRFLHVAQDAFYRDLTPEEQVNISAHNFDHPNVRPAVDGLDVSQMQLIHSEPFGPFSGTACGWLCRRLRGAR